MITAGDGEQQNVQPSHRDEPLLNGSQGCDWSILIVTAHQHSRSRIRPPLLLPEEILTSGHSVFPQQQPLPSLQDMLQLRQGMIENQATVWPLFISSRRICKHSVDHKQHEHTASGTTGIQYRGGLQFLGGQITQLVAAGRQLLIFQLALPQMI